jgi:hypothetical protein
MTMTTITARLKQEFPVLTKSIDGEIFELDVQEYDETIERWVKEEIRLADEEAAKLALEAKKQAVLAKLGLDAEEVVALLA